MLAHLSKSRVWVSVALAGLVFGHQCVFHPAMFGIYGTGTTILDYNDGTPPRPLWQMKYADFWVHNINNYGRMPPPPGIFLDIPSGKSFTVEIADNLANSSLRPNATLTAWPDGREHPANLSSYPRCITQPNLHTFNRSWAAGTAFAISYESDFNKVTPEDFTVFTVAPQTPFERLTTYEVPSGMPPCPDEGCLCIWGWVPRGCGEPNIYLYLYRARVISDTTSPKKIGKPQPAKWCEDDPSQCVRGPKQVLIWNQAERNNIEVEGFDLEGMPKSPGYNSRCGFSPGAQNDIFVDDPSATSAATATNATNAAVSHSSDPLAASSTKTGTSSASHHGSSLPAGSSTPTLPASTPTPSVPVGSASHLPTGTNTPSSPSYPGSSLPAESGTHTGAKCHQPTQDFPGTHSRRMKARRANHNIF